MELPASLRQAVDAVLDGIPLSELQRSSDILSRRYRAEVLDGRLHLSDEKAATAYLAARLPATYAAVRTSLEMVAQAMPDFAPRSLLDVGAGPGTVLWAAADCWPRLDEARLFEASDQIRHLGERLSTHNHIAQIEWMKADVTRGQQAFPKVDIVTLSYVLDEMKAEAGLQLVEQLWTASASVLVIVEPGTPAGWRRLMQVRERLLQLGGHVIAPCSHDLACPLSGNDWCHFSRRVARSRIHRQTKKAEVPWEDEKFSFLAIGRQRPTNRHARIIAPPRASSGKIQLKLCESDGQVTEKLFTKRDGELFRQARRADWGSVL